MSNTWLVNSSSTPPLVLGTPYRLQVDRTAAYVTVSNQSPNLDVQVSIANSQPPFSATPAGAEGIVLHQGDIISIPVPLAALTQTANGP